LAFDETRARKYAQKNLMDGEDLLRIGNFAKVKGLGKVYLILTTHRFMLVGKKGMKDFLLRDITNVGWHKKIIKIKTMNDSATDLKGKLKWRRTYDDFLKSVREQQLGFGVGKPAHLANQKFQLDQKIQLDVRNGSVDVNQLLEKLKAGGLVSVYKCPSCGGSIKISGATSADKLSKCEYCGTILRTDDLVDFMKSILS